MTSLRIKTLVLKGGINDFYRVKSNFMHDRSFEIAISGSAKLTCLAENQIVVYLKR